MDKTMVCRSFLSCYLDGKAENNMNEEDIARALGYKSRATLKAKRDDPLSFTLGDVFKLADLFGWGAEDLVHMFRSAID